MCKYSQYMIKKTIDRNASCIVDKAIKSQNFVFSANECKPNFIRNGIKQGNCGNTSRTKGLSK